MYERIADPDSEVVFLGLALEGDSRSLANESSTAAMDQAAE